MQQQHRVQAIGAQCGVQVLQQRAPGQDVNVDVRHGLPSTGPVLNGQRQ